MFAAITAGRSLIARRRGRGEGPRLPRLALAAIALAGVAAGYLLGRRASEAPAVAATNGAAPPPAAPAMEVATAVEVSRPQPAELDEIVPAVNAKS